MIQLLNVYYMVYYGPEGRTPVLVFIKPDARTNSIETMLDAAMNRLSAFATSLRYRALVNLFARPLS